MLIFQVHVTIQDVNDNNPVFTQKYYHVSVAENAQLNPPAAVLQLNALDADSGIFGEVKYAVVANDNSLFQLDPNSGILYPSQSLKGKEGNQYTLLTKYLEKKIMIYFLHFLRSIQNNGRSKRWIRLWSKC